jgi:Ni/Fe-hydrogenase subunit HybB-like protein
MSLLLLALLVVPFAALAIIFTVRPGRPLLLVVEAAIAFTVSSAAGGLSLLILATAWVGRLAGRQAGVGVRGFARLGRGLLLLDALAVLAAVGGELAGLASGDAAAAATAEAIRGRAYGLLFFGELGLLFLAAAVLWLAAWRRRLGVRVVVVASALSVVAVCLERHVGLLAWQTHGLLLPYRPGAYSPSAIEIAVLLGILALSLLALRAAVRFAPFAPAAFDERPVAKPPGGRGRVLVIGILCFVGLALVAAGLLLCLRVGTEPYLDPVVPGSPVLYIVGLAVLLTAGAVYELLPDRAGRASQGR